MDGNAEKSSILVVADATDPVATGTAIGALQGLSNSVFARDLVGPAASLAPKAPPYEIRVHRRYNPTGATRLNIVPGLMGTILTLTMLIFTALSVTREIERGTMESLLSMPIRPVEIMLGKIAPYVMVGAMQMTLILVAAHLLFDVPIVGDLGLLVGLTMLFIVASLSVGYTFSTIATNQLQAMQMSFDPPPLKWSALRVCSSQGGTTMPRKRHKPEEIVAKLRQVDVLVSQGQSVAEAVRSIGVTEVTYYRWRQEFGGLKSDQVKRLKDLETENTRLRRAIADLTLDKLILQEAARGNF